jgi:HlyD family secretion protein
MPFSPSPAERLVVKRTIPVILVVLSLAAGGYLYARSRRPVTPAYVTTAATRGHLEAKVTATGTVSPLVTVTVGSQISGQISKLYADWNTKVKKGQVIARLDTALLEASVDQCKANLLAAEGNLAKAKAQAFDATHQATRSSELLAKKLVAQADTDTAQATALADDAAVKAAEGQLAQNKSALDQSRINLAYATIYSPINGIVISRSVDVGQTVAAAMSAPTLFTIAEDLEKMQVDTSVAESDVGKITSGMDASFTVDAYPGERFRGKVRQIRNSPTTLQNVVTYDAVVDVPNPELKLKPGMTANVSFVYAQRKDVIKIPSAALRFQPADQMTKTDAPSEKGDKGDKGKGRHHPGTNDPRTVWLLRDGKAVSASIHVGITDSSSVEVLDGLNEGDLVITDTTESDTKKTQQQMGGQPPGGRRPF